MGHTISRNHCCAEPRLTETSFFLRGAHPRLARIERLEDGESDLLMSLSLHGLHRLAFAHRVPQALGALGAVVGTESFGPREEGRQLSPNTLVYHLALKKINKNESEERRLFVCGFVDT